MRDFMMYTSVVVNVMALFGMVGGVLMHSGQGGGLSDMFGGAGSTGLGSTAAERNLTRITTVLGIIWIGTVVALSFLLVR